MKAPDVIRSAYAELIVSDLAASRQFYVDVLGLVVTHEDDDAIYLRAFEEYLHHSLILRKGPVPALAALAYRVRSQDEVEVAATYFTELGCPVERRAAGATRGVGEAVRVEDPLGFPIEFFYDSDHVERWAWAFHVSASIALRRLRNWASMKMSLLWSKTTPPPIEILPPDGRSRPASAVSVVDFPQPDGPRSVRN